MNEDKTGVATAAPGSKIDRETAEAEFFRYCDNNEIEYDESSMNEDEKDSFDDIKKTFVKACMAGRVEVDGTSLKYTLSKFSAESVRNKPIILKRPGGNAFSSMDGFKERENVKKLHAFMSAMTGQDLKYFTLVDALDWKFFSGMATLFLSL